jgi:predicted HTH domain antitoxin
VAVLIQLPPPVEARLRARDPALEELALESLLIALYRRGEISTGDIAETLGVSTRSEAEAWLGERGVRANYSLGDLDDDGATLDRLLGPGRR